MEVRCGGKIEDRKEKRNFEDEKLKTKIWRRIFEDWRVKIKHGRSEIEVGDSKWKMKDEKLEMEKNIESYLNNSYRML